MNKSESIREFIRELFNQNHDFSNRDLNKTKFVEHFESEANKPLGVTWKEHQTLFVDQLKSVCKERNVSPSTYGYAKEKKSFQASGTSTKWHVQPKPKQVASSAQPAQNAIANTQQSAGQTPQTAPQEKITPMSDDEAFKLSRIIGKTIVNFIHAARPKFLPLDDTEADELGAALSPIAKPYLEQHGGKWFTLLAVGASIASKRKDAFGKGDKKTEPESDPKNHDTPDQWDEAQVKAFEKWQKEHQR